MKGKIMNYNNSAKGQQGFTLVELSIVLVIIGLLIGGVLVGQNLIVAAQIRSTISQYEKYNTAVNTFRNKYNGIPGDLTASRATLFGLTALAGGNGLGDGDGIIEGSGGNVSAATIGAGESTLFWKHLSQANMIEGSYDGSQAAGAIDTTFPRAKTGVGGWAAISGAAATNGLGRNFYQIGVTASAAAAVHTAASALTPEQAYQIDSKIDDGVPSTGIVIARGDVTIDTAADEAATGCVTENTLGDTAALYRLTITGVVCQVRLAMQ